MTGRRSQADVRLELRIKNNRLWQAIHARYPSTAACVREMKKIGFSGGQCEISALLNFRASPVDEKGEYRKICLDLSTMLGVQVEELFPKDLYEQMRDRAGLQIKTIESEHLLLINLGPERLLELPDTSQSVLDSLIEQEDLTRRAEHITRLSPREREVLELRFGLRGDGEKTLEQTGNIIGRNKERVRQIQARALRKLQQDLG